MRLLPIVLILTIPVTAPRAASAFTPGADTSGSVISVPDTTAHNEAHADTTTRKYYVTPWSTGGKTMIRPAYPLCVPKKPCTRTMEEILSRKGEQPAPTPGSDGKRTRPSHAKTKKA